MNYFKPMAWLLALPLFLFALSGSVAEAQFDVGAAAGRKALSEGRLKDALKFYESEAQAAEKNALASFFSQQYWESASMAYVEAGRVAQLAGQLQKGVFYGTKALEIAEKTKDAKLQANAISMLVEAYRSLREFAKARTLIEQGLKFAQEIPNKLQSSTFTGVFYVLLGQDLMRLREYDRAINAFSRAVALRESNLSELSLFDLRSRPPRIQTLIENQRIGLINRLTHLGGAYRLAGKFPQALEQYQRAFDSIKAWGIKYPLEGDLHFEMGELYLQQKNFVQALETFQKAATLAEGQQRPDAIASASTRMGDVARQTGKPSDAVPHYQKAIQQIESTRSLLQSEEFRQSYFEGGLGAYVNLIGVLLESGKPEEAFNYSERSRSRVFLDVLGRKVQLTKIKGGLLEEERALQEQIAAIRATLSGGEEEGTDRSGLTKRLAEAESAYNAFLAKVRSQDKEQASLMNVEPLTLKQVQELIDPAHTLIECFVTDGEVLVWVIEKDKLNFQRIALSKNDLAKQVKTLREMISTLGDTKELNEVSSSLYKSLIQPFLPQITGKELIIVPHDVLHYLPFQALIGSDGRYLIEKYPINYLSSASLLQFTKEKRRAQGEKVLALGNPDLGDPKMNLEFAEIEAKEIKNLYPQSTIFLEKDATEERAKTLAPNNDIIHFASHAELNENDPLSSAVLLAKSDKEDGRLEVREIFGMDLKASLVVLSACETGLGKLSSGDELVGLTRAFIYAGTPSVVASLWNVEDSSTAQLMASFYKNLKTMTKVEALRQAQLNLIRGNVNSDLLARRGIGGVGKLGEVPTAKPASDSIPNSPLASVSTAHPYFWAPFILVGEGK
jgi:CHAT domain-containing protein